MGERGRGAATRPGLAARDVRRGPGAGPWAGRRRWAGSAQVCTLQGKKLKVANLGDSGLMVLRDRQVVLRTQPQQHFFNCPFQMSCPELLRETDTSDDAEE